MMKMALVGFEPGLQGSEDVRSATEPTAHVL